MGRIYVHPDVAAVRRLHAEQRSRGAAGVAVAEWIGEQAATVGAALERGDAAGAIHLRAVDPGFSARSIEEILDAPPGPDAVHAAVARDHGYGVGEPVSRDRIDAAFETALDAIEANALEAFRRLLADAPELARARSTFGHRATLLHHLTANGVEVVRQAVPIDTPRFAMVLVEAGADVHATADVYGGRWSVRGLLETSAHPATAGVDREFAHVLDVAGA